MPDLPPIPRRYSRQILFAGLGREGHDRIRQGSVALVGCGALGTHLADHLVRAGVGRLTLVDRDFVEESNLQRQVLFDEDDARAGTPKAIAAAARLSRVNRDVAITPHAEDLTPGNVTALLAGHDLLLDGTDNFTTRYLINDFAVQRKINWIYGACVGASGMTMTILPGRTPCLRCVFEAPPPAELSPTCDTAGVIAPIVAAVAAFQAAEALKLLAGRTEALRLGLCTLDLWDGTVRSLQLMDAPSPACPACAHGRFEHLAGVSHQQAVTLCGRDSVQITPAAGTRVALPALAERLRAVGPVEQTPYLVRFAAEGLRVTVFAGGRAILSGTSDPARARAVYARYVGG